MTDIPPTLLCRNPLMIAKRIGRQHSYGMRDDLEVPNSGVEGGACVGQESVSFALAQIRSQKVHGSPIVCMSCAEGVPAARLSQVFGAPRRSPRLGSSDRPDECSSFHDSPKGRSSLAGSSTRSTAVGSHGLDGTGGGIAGPTVEIGSARLHGIGVDDGQPLLCQAPGKTRQKPYSEHLPRLSQIGRGLRLCESPGHLRSSRSRALGRYHSLPHSLRPSSSPDCPGHTFGRCWVRQRGQSRLLARRMWCAHPDSGQNRSTFRPMAQGKVAESHGFSVASHPLWPTMAGGNHHQHDQTTPGLQSSSSVNNSTTMRSISKSDHPQRYDSLTQRPFLQSTVCPNPSSKPRVSHSAK
jgi:hypothetical protein